MKVLTITVAWHVVHAARCIARSYQVPSCPRCRAACTAPHDTAYCYSPVRVQLPLAFVYPFIDNFITHVYPLFLFSFFKTHLATNATFVIPLCIPNSLRPTVYTVALASPSARTCGQWLFSMVRGLEGLRIATCPCSLASSRDVTSRPS